MECIVRLFKKYEQNGTATIEQNIFHSAEQNVYYDQFII